MYPEHFALLASFAVYDFVHRKERKVRKDQFELFGFWLQSSLLNFFWSFNYNEPQMNANERRFRMHYPRLSAFIRG